MIFKDIVFRVGKYDLKSQLLTTSNLESKRNYKTGSFRTMMQAREHKNNGFLLLDLVVMLHVLSIITFFTWNF